MQNKQQEKCKRVRKIFTLIYQQHRMTVTESMDAVNKTRVDE